MLAQSRTLGGGCCWVREGFLWNFYRKVYRLPASGNSGGRVASLVYDLLDGGLPHL